MEERLKQQLDFILEIDKEKNILRQTHLSGHQRTDFLTVTRRSEKRTDCTL